MQLSSAPGDDVKGEDIKRLVEAELDDATFTYDEALDSMGFGVFQFILIMICGGGYFIDGIELSLIAFTIPALTSYWDLNPLQTGLLGGAVYLGMMIGSLGSIISDKIGRRFIFVTAILFTALSGFSSAFSPNYFAFLCLRTIVGVGLGLLVPTDYAMVMEFIPKDNRGTVLGVMNFFWILGNMFECLLAWVINLSFPYNIAWRYLIALSASPGFISFLLRLIVPESPRYLLLKGDVNGVMKSLHWIAKLNGKSLPNGKLALVKQETTNHNSVPFFSQISLLFSKSLSRTTVLLTLIWFCLSFSSWGFNFLAPTIFKKLNQDSDLNYSNIYLKTFGIMLISLFGYVLVAIIIDKVPRRKLLAMSFFLGSIFVALVSFSSTAWSFLVLAGIFSFISCFPWACMYVYSSEVYPTLIRATGLGLTSAFTRLAGVVAPPCGTLLLSRSFYLPFITFGAAALLAAIACCFLPVETIGKDIKDSISSLEEEEEDCIWDQMIYDRKA